MVSVGSTLDTARALLHGRGGEKAALSLLEKRAHEDSDVHSSAAIWACIAQLRSSLGRSTEAQDAMDRATLLRTAPARKLTFDTKDHNTSTTPNSKRFAWGNREPSTGRKRRQSLIDRTDGNKNARSVETGSSNGNFFSEQLADVRRMSARCIEILASANFQRLDVRTNLTPGDVNADVCSDSYDNSGPVLGTEIPSLEARVVQLKKLQEWTSNLLVTKN